MLTIVSILVIWVEDNHHCLHSDDLCGRDDKNNHRHHLGGPMSDTTEFLLGD